MKTVALPLAIVAALGCADESKPRLYRTSPVPPSWLVTDAPLSRLHEIDPSQKVPVTAASARDLQHLGASLMEDSSGGFWGINFSVYSQRAEKVQVLLFDDPESPRPTRQFDLTRFGDVWNVYVEGIGLGQHYGYIAWGPNWEHDPAWYPGSMAGFFADVDAAGNRFNPNKLLFDPYCKAFHRDFDWSKGNAGTGPFRADLDWAAAMKCRVVRSGYAWGPEEEKWRADRQRDLLDGHRANDLVIYEVHAKGFTMNRSSGVRHPGTFLGFAEKADYLEELGVNAVELMPPFEKPLEGGYWGYNTIGFFAPELSYASRNDQAEAIDEFKRMVEELHKRGIEVILDVVYNHSGEGGLWREKVFRDALNVAPWNIDPQETASLLTFRGLDNASYFALPPANQREYCDYTGVGNTMRNNSEPMRRLIIDNLRYWVEEMHVDGFRFDLAPALGAKDLQYAGCPTSQNKAGSGIQWDVEGTMVREVIEDPVLQKRNVRIIAEPWGGGGYPVGQFPASKGRPDHAWGEWNNAFRDWWRTFVNFSDPLNKNEGGIDGGGTLTGSRARFQPSGRRPPSSVNFVTCHDGMTMYDVLSYDQKVNDCSPLNPVCCTSPLSSFCDEAKRSGTDDNRSKQWDKGGPCGTTNCNFGQACYEDQCIDGEEMKRQLMRDFFVAMLISHGTPMLYGGDEWLRTQLGNNNTYTPEADNPYSWHDWGAWLAKDDRYRMFDFVRKTIRLRKEHAYAFAPPDYGQEAPFSWKSELNGDPNWSSRRLMIHYHDRSRGPELAVLINMEGGTVRFQLPTGRSWRRLVDTQRYFDQVGYLNEKQLPLRESANATLERPEPVGAAYDVKSRAIVILEAP